MRRLSTSLLLILLLSIPLAGFAQVYTWTDAHGTVHYSDSPPPHGVTYKDIKIPGATVEPQPTHRTHPHEDTASSTPSPPAHSSGRMQDTPANRKKLCGNLHANLKLLKGGHPVIYKDNNGKNQVMSKARKAQALAQTQKRLKKYCR